MNALVKHYDVWVEWIVVARNLHERSQEFENVREKIEDLIPHLNRFKKNANAAIGDGDQAEKRRRSELFGCAHRLSITSTLVNGLHSALEEIEKRSREMLAKGPAVRFMDRAADSGEVARLVKRLREAITHYQVSEDRSVASSFTHAGGQISQQQAIYDKITTLTVRIPPSVSICCADN